MSPGTPEIDTVLKRLHREHARPMSAAEERQRLLDAVRWGHERLAYERIVGLKVALAALAFGTLVQGWVAVGAVISLVVLDIAWWNRPRPPAEPPDPWDYP